MDLLSWSVPTWSCLCDEDLANENYHCAQGERSGCNETRNYVTRGKIKGNRSFCPGEYKVTLFMYLKSCQIEEKLDLLFGAWKGWKERACGWKLTGINKENFIVTIAAPALMIRCPVTERVHQGTVGQTRGLAPRLWTFNVFFEELLSCVFFLPIVDKRWLLLVQTCSFMVNYIFHSVSLC